MSARAEVLDRIRRAVGGGATAAAVPRAYRRAGEAADVDLMARLVDRLTDYRATVVTTTASQAPAAVADRLRDRTVATLVVPPGFPDELVPVDRVRVDGATATVAELDVADGTISTCALAVAETGTIVLDAGPGMGRRALSLVPDYLLIVVRSDQVVASVPDAIAGLDATRPLTWISGPSATSDIELRRVEGVHGPRTLDVVLVAP